eukprot:CAMPEP_0113850880 /NCGR_PEP_ID=MMETSP0372-20130328/4209_1 /TAXON_ID=340204 /ORGANISM="Lankesteria abbotti" /LENGTH=140 /DNA_ID=CAMNT_0000821385 /DNA_START=116 /DNA_END=535 /DNA_ORIENTATION=- /assembly_acc=CAM_ASM_000359
MEALQSDNELTAFLQDTKSQKSNDLFLLAFVASWSGCCNDVERNLLSLKKELPKQLNLRIALVDVELLPDVAEREGIVTVPTFKLYRNAEEVDVLTGSNFPLLEARVVAEVAVDGLMAMRDSKRVVFVSNVFGYDSKHGG